MLWPLQISPRGAKEPKSSYGRKIVFHLSPQLLKVSEIILTVTVVLVFLWRFHVRGHVEIVECPWKTINFGCISGREQLPVLLCWVSKVCLSFPVHGGVGSLPSGLGWEKREHLGQTKFLGLRYCSAFYQLQKPAATVNHKGGGCEEELSLECERWDKIHGKRQG